MLSVDLKYIPIKTPASRRASSSLSERWFGWRSSAFLQPEWGPLTLFLLKGGGDGPLPHGVGSEPLAVPSLAGIVWNKKRWRFVLLTSPLICDNGTQPCVCSL